MRHPDAWREMAAKGHELGNHSIFHPCCKDRPEGMQWLPDAYDLRTYTPQRWTDEMRAANFALSLIDGQSERSFGNTCCNTELGQGETRASLEPLIAELFVAGRGPFNQQVVDVASANFNALGHFGGNGQDFDALQREIDGAMETGGWTIYMIHGVGEGTHGHYIDVEEHRKLVDYLGERQNSIWIAPVVQVAQYLQGCDPDYAPAELGK